MSSEIIVISSDDDSLAPCVVSKRPASVVSIGPASKRPAKYSLGTEDKYGLGREDK